MWDERRHTSRTTSSSIPSSTEPRSEALKTKDGIPLIERLLPYCWTGWWVRSSVCLLLRSVVLLERQDFFFCYAEMFDPTKFQGFLLCVCRRCVVLTTMTMIARMLLTTSNNTTYVSFVGSCLLLLQEKEVDELFYVLHCTEVFLFSRD